VEVLHREADALRDRVHQKGAVVVNNRLSSSGDTASPPPIPPGRNRRRDGRDIARSISGELLILVVCAIFWSQTYKFEDADADGLGPTFVPRLLIGLLVLCVLVRVVQTFLARPGLQTARSDAEGTHPDAPEDAEEEHPTSRRYLLVGVGLAVGYVLATMYLGYPLATFLLVVGFVGINSRLTWHTFAVALAVALSFPYLFVRIVFIDLPTGVGVFDSFTIALYSALGIY
jgi:putative tricarboxylic transport membrane protein